MSRAAPQIPDRVLELLTDQASVGLDDSERAELDAVLRDDPSLDDESFEAAAAAAMLAFASPELEPMPAALFERVSTAGRRWSSGRRRVAHQPALGEARNGLRLAGTEREPASGPIPARRAPRRLPASAGWLAAAAAIALAAVAWTGGGRDDGGQAGPVTDPAAALAALRNAGDIVTAGWTRGPDPSGAACTGEVVWCPSRQEGYMVFSGLKPNDPSREQYQLWIFDRDRDAAYPVHGGLFDIPEGKDEVVVRIEPRLRVDKAYQFVLTVERPDGVWVSDRSRIPVLAQLDG